MSHQTFHGAGKSSLDLVDHELVFHELGLDRGKIFLDLGCGRGDYTIAAAEMVGPDGIAYGVDGWQEGIDILINRALEKNLTNIKTLVADISLHVPLPDNSVDVCLMATVLHDLARDGGDKQALLETSRVIRNGGMLGIVEFKKVEGPPGPPIHIRLDGNEVGDMIAHLGFHITKTLDVGPYTYLLVATKKS